MKIRPVGAELFRADGWIDRQTDRYDKANRRFRNFANAPNKKVRSNCGFLDDTV